jgi:hypothetical protein
MSTFSDPLHDQPAGWEPAGPGPAVPARTRCRPARPTRPPGPSRVALPAGGAGRAGGGGGGPAARSDSPRWRRGYDAYDAYGDVVAWFVDWEAAHDWAHTHAASAGTHAPVEIDDRPNRVTRRVSPDSCELITWTGVARPPSRCDRNRGRGH